MVSTMSDFKKSVMEGSFPTIHSSKPMPDLRSLGVYLMARVIPKMEELGEMAFAWHWAGNDVCAYTHNDYSTETGSYKKLHKMKCCKGDTVWNYDYTFKGKKRRCIMETEIWYKPDTDHNVSPIAMVFGQFMSPGFHFVKCRWESLE